MSAISTENIFPWQQDNFAHLSASWQQRRFPHAWLFFGPVGIGKLSFARNLAQLILCQAPLSGQGCGVCSACQQVLGNYHPDLQILQEEGLLKIAAIQELRNSAQQTAHQHAKVFIIDAPEKLTVGASNALLKILEEPPADTYFLLVSASSNLLATIRSRTTILRFDLPPAELAHAWLVEQSNLDPKLAKLALFLASGAPLLALEFLNSAVLNFWEGLLQDLLDLNAQNLLAIAQKWEGQEIEWLLGLKVLRFIIFELIRFHLYQDKRLVSRQTIALAAQKYALANLWQAYDKIQAVFKHLAQATAINKQLFYENFLIGLIGNG